MAIRMGNTGTSTVDGNTEQLFLASRLGACVMCSYACTEAFNFELGKGGIAKITFILYVEKTKLGNPSNN